jgi:hypothetical protein
MMALRSSRTDAACRARRFHESKSSPLIDNIMAMGRTRVRLWQKRQAELAEEGDCARRRE